MLDIDNCLIRVDKGLTEGKLIHNCAILCRAGRIYAVGGHSAFTEANCKYIINLPGCYATPGFVDSHIYGFGNHSLDDCINESPLQAMASILPQHGVTSFVPSLQSTQPELLLGTLSALAAAFPACAQLGARPVGIHLISPFINPGKHGSAPTEGVRAFTEREALAIIHAAAGHLRIMTFAPEMPGAADLQRLLRQAGVIPSMGHSVAGPDEVLAAIALGATRVTHLYNCMPPLHQRQIGLASTALVDERVICELIFDGFHIHPQMLDLACKIKGARGVIAVSVANQGTGLPDGEYHFKKRTFIIKDQHMRLPDGTIAGSMISQDRAWRNILNYTHLKPTEAISCFTAAPARNLGLLDRGHLSPGLLADLVVFNQEHEVELTLINGQVAYCKNPQIIKKNESYVAP